GGGAPRAPAPPPPGPRGRRGGGGGGGRAAAPPPPPAPGVRAIVIAAAGRSFPAGADIREFGLPPVPPLLPEVLDVIESCLRPVVAALHGTALGGGLELALAAHYRVALAGTRLGFPEVTLGILPGAGGTQRTPRITGAAAALSLMRGGQPVTAAEAERLGLVDLVVADPGPGEGAAAAARRAAIAFARGLLAEGLGARPTRERREGLADAAAYAEAVRAARADPPPAHLPAAARIVDCVEAALLLPFESGLAYERAAFEDLLASEAAQGLRHAFLAERRAAHVPGLDGVAPRPVEVVGVVGGGLMGAGIAAAALTAGLGVVLVEREGEALDRGLARVAEIKERAVEKGRLSREGMADEWARLIGTTDIGAMAGVDLAVEAVYEDPEVKAGVFRQLDAVLRPGAVLASNTSYLDVDALAAVTGRPAEVVGLHFFSPAHVMRLVEVVVGRATAPDVAATGMALARRMGKIPVRAGVCDGFIGNRILTAYRTAMDFLVEDGASPYAVDAAMRAFGFPLGPYEVADLAGLEIGWARRRRLAPGRDPAHRYVAIADRLCERGWFGQKTGRGWYRHDEGRRGAEDREVLALVEAERVAKGILPRAVDAGEIAARALAAMVNEGARILAEGVALRPSDIDVVMLHGYGYPRWRGGPMRTADHVGLLVIRKQLLGWAAAEPEFWTPAPLLLDLVKNGRDFAALNTG
ncbi:MAG: enoyl-CoA hydratase/isomerase family protein, partial [Rhodobacteraceae bacterium]|nr:enoyl-CoA hydratase/isomerase family protein [Paracoccaceae bacterium]